VRRNAKHGKKEIRKVFFFFFFSRCYDNSFLYNIQEGSVDYFVLDCYLLSTCDSDGTVIGNYIYTDFVNGVDGTSCGEEANPCKTIPYALDKAQARDEVRLLGGNTDITSVSYSLPPKQFSVSGVPAVVEGVPLYPQIFMSYANTYVFQFSKKLRGTFDSFRVLVNASAKVQMRFFLELSSNGNDSYLRIKFDKADYFYGWFFFFLLAI
jgi:hypothetical protein